MEPPSEAHRGSFSTAWLWRLLFPRRGVRPLQAVVEGRPPPCTVLSVMDSLAGRPELLRSAMACRIPALGQMEGGRRKPLRMMHRTIEALHHRR